MSTKPLRNWLLLILLVYCALEVLSLGSLFALRHHRGIAFDPADRLSDRHRQLIEGFLHNPPSYTVYSSSLGWTIKPNGASKLYRANSQGIRGDREYSFTPPPGFIRISSFGDSFTHCHDVENQDTWQERLTELLPNSEVLNFGVGAYGLDQALLRYRQEGVRFISHIILIGYWPGDIYRNVNVFRPFLSPKASSPLTKPRFTVMNGDLALLPNPMRELDQYNELLANPRETLNWIGTHDHFYGNTRYESCRFDFLPSVRLAKIAKGVINRKYRNDIISDGYYNEASEAFDVTRRIFDQFYESAAGNKSLPVFVLFPGRDDVAQYLKAGTKKYSPLLKYFDKSGYLYVDLLGAFDNAGRDYEVGDLFVGHYSPLANRLAAGHIHDYLRERGLTDPAGVSRALNN
jgi:hypothetical protein